MVQRLKLQEILQNVMGSNKVYFSPPESVKITYPCIIYDEVGSDTHYADDRHYVFKRQYDVKIIDQTPSSAYPSLLIDALPNCSHDRTYIADGLVHYQFTIFI